MGSPRVTLSCVASPACARCLGITPCQQRQDAATAGTAGVIQLSRVLIILVCCEGVSLSSKILDPTLNQFVIRKALGELARPPLRRTCGAYHTFALLRITSLLSNMLRSHFGPRGSLETISEPNPATTTAPEQLPSWGTCPHLL